MTKVQSIALLGGPSSGKTTWLGAVANLIDQERLPQLTRTQLSADTRSIDTFVEPLLEGKYPPRTPHGHRAPISLHLRATQDDGAETPFTLQVEDFAGEDMERVFSDRLWPEAWHAWSESANGVLLFVRPTELVRLPPIRPPAVSAFDRLLGPLSPPMQLGPPDPAAAFGGGFVPEAPETPRAASRDPQRVPTTLALIELLQLLRAQRGVATGVRAGHGLRVAIVVTAWDAEEADKTPNEWLAQNAPILEDYLWSNFAREDVMRFGLSSTGVDLRVNGNAERYEEDPRGFVVWADLGKPRREPDIGLPMRWALFGASALKTG
jgi:hypothetical protein